MIQENYQQWLQSLKQEELAFIQQPIPEDEQMLYRNDGQWRYSLVKVTKDGEILPQSLDTDNFFQYSPTTGEILEPMDSEPIPNSYLVPVFLNVDPSSTITDVISNVSVYPLERNS